MLTQDQKQAWVAALRSGKYEQGEGRLCTVVTGVGGTYSERYCCLGVLAEVLNVPRERSASGYAYNFRDSPMLNPMLNTVPEGLLTDSSVGILIIMNDSQNKSFLEIADWIERNLATKD